MEFDWTDAQDQFRRDVVAFLDQELPPGWEDTVWDVNSHERMGFTQSFPPKLAERHWLLPHFPEEFGGMGESAWHYMILCEELYQRGEPRGAAYMIGDWIAPAIILAGSEEQRAFHLPKLCRGEVVWCQGFSEPDAGSDLFSLKTRAERDGDEYVVNGQKIWTSFADEAQFCFLLVRTNPEALKQEGISILIVPTDTPGFEIREVKSFLGGHIFHEMFFTDMRVPVADRLGPENAGVSIIRQVIAFERTGSPRFAKAARILDRLAEWAKVNGRDLAEFHQEFALARADCEAARNLAYFVANEQVKGHPPSAWPYASRMATIRAERAVAELAVKVAGEESLIANSLAGAQDLWSLSSGIGGGSYEMSVNSVARQCLGLPKG